MALPLSLSNVTLLAGSFAPKPFISSAGNVYLVLLDSADNSLIEVHKATDPTSAFTEQDSANKPNLTNNVGTHGFHAVQVGDVIHIVTGEATTFRVGYHTFNMATDAWAIVNETVTTSAATGGTTIGVRSDGDVIVLYQGPNDTVTMTD